MGPFPHLPGSPPLASSPDLSGTFLHAPSFWASSARAPCLGSQFQLQLPLTGALPELGPALCHPGRHRPSCPPECPLAGPWAAASRDSVKGTLTQRCTGAHARWLPQTLGTHEFPRNVPVLLGWLKSSIQVLHKLEFGEQLFSHPNGSVLYCVFQFAGLEPA